MSPLPSLAQSGGFASAQDKTWLETSMQGDRFEIFGGMLALGQTQNPGVRRIARVLIRDHRASLKDAAHAAHGLAVDVPHEPSPSQQWELDMLHRLRGPAFDQAYLSLEIKDHIQDISESTNQSQTGTNAAVVRLAREDIGTLHRHLHLSHLGFQRLPR